MYVKRLLTISLIALLAGCATAWLQPTRTSIDKSRTYNAPYGKVWSAIIGEVAESNLNITTLDKSSGIVAISNSTYEPDWADEGLPGSVLGVPDLVVNRDANFNILATRQNPDETRVEVNSNLRIEVRHGNGSLSYPYTYQWQQAYSNGTLEKIILDGVARRVQQ